jgi:MSHA biogenesis protein MshJ
MNKKIESINQWILARDTRGKFILFCLSLLFIYVIFYFIFLRPVKTKMEVLQGKISELKTQRETIEQQFKIITNIVNSPEFSSLLGQRQLLIQQTKHVQKKIESFKPVFVSEQDVSQVTKDVLGQLDNGVMLVNLKKFPLQRLVIPDIDKENRLIQNIYQHKLTIQLNGNFFNVLSFLTRLEKLPWHLYWDSLEYKVTKYPEANVTIQLYVLSNEKSP